MYFEFVNLIVRSQFALPMNDEQIFDVVNKSFIRVWPFIIGKEMFQWAVTVFSLTNLSFFKKRTIGFTHSHC